MKPEATKVLEHTALSLLGEIAPAVSPPYLQASVSALGAMLLVTREEFERAASRRVIENDALRELFTAARPVVTDDALKDRLAEAAAGRDDSLLVTDLEAGNQRLRALLVELHAHVEGLTLGGANGAAEELEGAIWRELAASTQRRQTLLSPF